MHFTRSPKAKPTQHGNPWTPHDRLLLQELSVYEGIRAGLSSEVESAPHTGLERGHDGTQPLILLPQNEVELGIG